MRCAPCLKIVYRWQVKLGANGWAYCPFCNSRVCKICGCANNFACPGPCAWREDDPAVCTAHTDEEARQVARQAARQVSR